MSINEKFKYGESLLNSENYSDAAKEFESVLENDEYNYLTLNYLGISYSMLKEYDKAINILHKAIESDSSLPNAYLNLAIILFQKGERQESLPYYKLAIEHDKKNTTAYYNYAVALNELGKYDEAKLYYEKAIEQNNNNYTAHHNLGLLNLLLGNYKDGWDGLEYRYNAEAVKVRIMPGKKWNGAPITNSTLYVYMEQGFGDVIQFVRFLPVVKAKTGKLILECLHSLFPLFKNLPGFDEIVEMDESLTQIKQYDYHCPITSLGKILKIDEDYPLWEKPYISVAKTSHSKWTDYFSHTEKKKIGIVWRSNSNYKYENKRAIPLTSLEKIFSIEGCKYFSLQMNPTPYELEILEKYDVTDLSRDIKNFSNTAEIIVQLDLIVSTDTAVPHLAGAMGKPTWLLLSAQPDWRWQLERKDSFWYPTLELFRQNQEGKWDSVVNEIFSRLALTNSTYIKEHVMVNVFNDDGMARLKKFLYKIKEDTYPETPMEQHTQISDKVIVELLEEIKLPPNAKILDIGCGQGLALKKFTEFGYNPVGITLNNTDYNISKTQGYEVYQMDQSFLQFKDKEFDFLWARHVLEHSIFPHYTLHEYSRVLKKGGLLYVEVPAAGFDAVHENNLNHYSVLNKAMWRSLFLRAKFDLISELDLNLQLIGGGQDQYWMFLFKKRDEDKNGQ